jgi:hypothetical protein
MFQSLGALLNYRFSPENVGTVNPEHLAPGVNLVDAWANVLEGEPWGGLTEQNRQFAQIWHESAPALEEAVRAAIYNAVNRPENDRLPVTFGGKPSSHFEVDFWEAAGGLCILLGMPLPRQGPPPAG